MNIKQVITCVLLSLVCWSAHSQVDSIKINDSYYYVYPFREKVKVVDEYWIAIKDKAFYENPENYFAMHGEDPGFTMKSFEEAEAEEDLKILNKLLKKHWGYYRKKRGRLGLGPRFVKQARKNPGELIRTRYVLNKEVLPPFEPIPDGKYVQLFEEVCVPDKKGQCEMQSRVAAFFSIKDNAFHGQAVWLDFEGDTLKQGNFRNGSKDGKWSIVHPEIFSMRLYRWDTKSFRKTGRFDGDTNYVMAHYANGILHGKVIDSIAMDRRYSSGYFTHGVPSGTWLEYKDNVLASKKTFADTSKFELTRKPIIRNNSYLNAPSEFDMWGWTFRRMEIPANLYQIGFSNENELELEEEKFKSHELEYYSKYIPHDEIPARIAKLPEYYNIYRYYNFIKDPNTGKAETFHHYLDSLGAKALYDGDYEIFYPNGQLFTRYKFKDGALVDEGTIYWDNGKPHDVIKYDTDSNYYVRNAYDYKGELYKTIIYDSLGEFSHIVEEKEEVEKVYIDGLVAYRDKYSEYNPFDFSEVSPANFNYSNWDTIRKGQLSGDKEIILYKSWCGKDSSVLSETTYNPSTRTVSSFSKSYTGKLYSKREKIYTEDFTSWTAKTFSYFENYHTEVISSATLNEGYENDTLPQMLVADWYEAFDVTSDKTIFKDGKPYNGKFKFREHGKGVKLKRNRLILKKSRYSNGKRVQRKLYKYFEKGKNADDPQLSRVNSIYGCNNVQSSIVGLFYPISMSRFFSGTYTNDYLSGYNTYRQLKQNKKIRGVKGQMVEGKPHGEWQSKYRNGKLKSRVAFINGEAEGKHEVYNIKRRSPRYERLYSIDSLPKKKTYYLYSLDNYHNGRQHGKSTEYHWYGTPESTGEYVDGYREGEFLEIQKLAYSRSQFKNGLLDGYYQTYLTLPRRDTMLLYDINFQGGLLNGESIAYHTNGKVAKKGFFLDGEPIKDYEAYDTLGFKYHYLKFKYGFPIEEKIWEENELSLRYKFNWEDSIDFNPADLTSTMSLQSLMYKLGYGLEALQEEYYGRPRLIDKTGLTYHMTKFYPKRYDCPNWKYRRRKENRSLEVL